MDIVLEIFGLPYLTFVVGIDAVDVELETCRDLVGRVSDIFCGVR